MEETIKIIRRKLAKINEANESQDIKENYIETRDNVTDIALLLCKVDRALGISFNEEKAALPLQNVRRSFWSEFKHPLSEVQRKWLRRPFVILNLLLIIPLGAICGMAAYIKAWFKQCW